MPPLLVMLATKRGLSTKVGLQLTIRIAYLGVLWQMPPLLVARAWSEGQPPPLAALANAKILPRSRSFRTTLEPENLVPQLWALRACPPGSVTGGAHIADPVITKILPRSRSFHATLKPESKILPQSRSFHTTLGPESLVP